MPTGVGGSPGQFRVQHRIHVEINAGIIMGSYEYVRFQTIDKPLDDEQLEFMNRQSSRAQISRVEFINEYHYGGFRGDAVEMMFRGYDIHILWNSYGTRNIMLRLNTGLPWSPDEFEEHFSDSEIQWLPDETGSGGVLKIVLSLEDHSGMMMPQQFDSFMSSLSTLRDQLEEGDPRVFYLAWLATCSDGDEDAYEPPVPAGLQTLTPALKELAAFLDIPDSLLAVAAERSPLQPSATPKTNPVDTWIAERSQTELQQIATQLLQDSTGTVRRKFLQQIRATACVDSWPVAQPSRTRAQLLEAMNILERQWRQQERDRAAEARRQKLEAMAANPAATIAKIFGLAANRTTVDYESAVSLLVELREALDPESAADVTCAAAAELRRQYPRARSLLTLLRSERFV